METLKDTKTDLALEREIFIRSQMRRKQINASRIAANHGWSRSAVNKQIKGIPISKEVRQAIADDIGEPYETVWGEE